MEEKVVLAAVALLLDEEEKEEEERKYPVRTVWTRPWIQRRGCEGTFHKIFKELMNEDSQGFKEYAN